MRTQFTILFSLRAVHTYFGGKVCNCLQFRPDAATMIMLKRFGFEVRYRVDGFTVYTSAADRAALLSYLAETNYADAFVFSMQSRRDDFVSFTDMPQDRQLVYDSNKTDHDELQAFYTAADNRGVTGNITIRFTDLLLAWQQQDAPAYSIRLRARTTQWQYFVVNRNALMLKTPTISNKKNIVFDGPVSVTIPTGEQALLFTSARDLIPFSEDPLCQFNLVNAGGSANAIGGNRIIYKGLPAADPSRMGVAEIDGQKVFVSPMYVYL